MRLKLQINTFFAVHPQRQVIQHLLDSIQRSSGFAVSQLQIAMQPLIFYNLTSKEAVTLNPIPPVQQTHQSPPSIKPKRSIPPPPYQTLSSQSPSTPSDHSKNTAPIHLAPSWQATEAPTNHSRILFSSAPNTQFSNPNPWPCSHPQAQKADILSDHCNASPLHSN